MEVQATFSIPWYNSDVLQNIITFLESVVKDIVMLAGLCRGLFACFLLLLFLLDRWFNEMKNEPEQSEEMKRK